MDFTWEPAGHISATARFVAVPDVTLATGSNTVDQTVLAAFVMLVALTVVQTGLVFCSISHGVRRTGSAWAVVQVCCFAIVCVHVCYCVCVGVCVCVCVCVRVCVCLLQDAALKGKPCATERQMLAK